MATVLAAAAILAVAGATPAQAATPRCIVRAQAIAALRHSRVVSTSGPLVLYRVRGSARDTYWTCLRGRSTRTRVGFDDSYQAAGSEYGPTTTVGAVKLAGNWVLATLETGDDSYSACTKYQVSSCSGPDDTLEVVDAATGARGAIAHIVIYSTSANAQLETLWSRTVLSPVGAVAWLTKTTTDAFTPAASSTESLDGCLLGGAAAVSCAPKLLAQGQVDPKSLAFSGATLSWTLGGQPASATIT